MKNLIQRQILKRGGGTYGRRVNHFFEISGNPYRSHQLDHNALREACFNQSECSKTAITICLLRYQPITARKNINKPIL